MFSKYFTYDSCRVSRELECEPIEIRFDNMILKVPLGGYLQGTIFHTSRYRLDKDLLFLCTEDGEILIVDVEMELKAYGSS